MARALTGVKRRPLCVCCGKGYGRRATDDEVVVWKRGEPMPPYRGNGVVVATSSSGSLTALLKALDAAGFKHEPNQMKAAYEYRVLHIWDGETFWVQYSPFCSTICAIQYAKRAYAKYGRIR